MKKYNVRIYLHTFVDVEVEAENDTMAKEEAELKEYDMRQILDNMTQDETDIDVEEIEENYRNLELF